MLSRTAMNALLALALLNTACASSNTETPPVQPPPPVPTVTTCAPSQVECAGTCVDPRIDSANCGACSNACRVQPGETENVCRAGKCVGACGAGYRTCGTSCCAYATKIAAGREHACAVLSDGGVSCWGSVAFGANPASLPGGVLARVPGVESATSIATSEFHSCAVVKNGDVFCWGRNTSGELGQGMLSASAPPGRVAGLTRPIRQLALGNKFSCALDVDGGAWCWGDNFFGQLANGSFDNAPAPQRVRRISGQIAAIAAGDKAALATTQNGRLYFWGLRERITNPGTIGYPEPIEIPIASDLATSVSMGYKDGCWVTNAGKVWCRGEVYKAFPSEDQEEVKGFNEPAVSVHAGRVHYCALMQSGSVNCWGSNNFGVLGTGDANAPRTLVPLQATILPSKVRALTVGRDFNCVLLDGDGSVRCWGLNGYGQSKPRGDNSPVGRERLGEPIDFPAQ